MLSLALLSATALVGARVERYKITKEPRIPTEDEVEMLRELIVLFDKEGDGSRRPHMVRGCFHDAGTWDQRVENGGAHACFFVPDSLQANAAPNRGFQEEPVAPLLAIYREEGLNEICTLADFFHFAAIVVIGEASEEAGERLDIPFRWGRRDCYDQGADFDPKEGYSSRLPSPTLYFDGIIENMGNKMGFNLEEIVALMGGHTLGEMGEHGGPYNLELLPGAWVPDKTLFNNAYYEFLSRRAFVPLSPEDGKGIFRVQWGGCFKETDKGAFDVECVMCESFGEGGDCFFSVMLRTDVELTSDTKDPSCTLGLEYAPVPQLNKECAIREKPLKFVKAFSRDNAAWLQAFSDAWVKLVEFTTDELFEARSNPKPVRNNAAYVNNDYYNANGGVNTNNKGYDATYRSFVGLNGNNNYYNTRYNGGYTDNAGYNGGYTYDGGYDAGYNGGYKLNNGYVY
eukprot:gb/GEZN01007395.1/.p1 GENE.gb/GEZN01007395.1/~~gb/GEZN01007395.1/.p1  ORF type:complete len:456 (+),score=67.54 gb/GEZN01007395.1/:3-1370(+)